MKPDKIALEPTCNTTSALSATRRGPDPNRPTGRALFEKWALTQPVLLTISEPRVEVLTLSDLRGRVLILTDPRGEQFFENWPMGPVGEPIDRADVVFTHTGNNN